MLSNIDLVNSLGVNVNTGMLNKFTNQTSHRLGLLLISLWDQLRTELSLPQSRAKDSMFLTNCMGKFVEESNRTNHNCHFLALTSRSIHSSTYMEN